MKIGTKIVVYWVNKDSIYHDIINKFLTVTANNKFETGFYAESESKELFHFFLDNNNNHLAKILYFKKFKS